VLDRAKLRAWVLRDDVAMRRLEFLMHPLVHREEQKFRTAAFRAGRRAVILDIPLLFETGAQLRVDTTITVSCPRDVQINRILKRGLPLPQIEAIIERQMPDALKRAQADYVIPTGLSKFHTMRAVRRIVAGLRT
jgi:dephospho-CoA kinase